MNSVKKIVAEYPISSLYIILWFIVTLYLFLDSGGFKQ